MKKLIEMIEQHLIRLAIISLVVLVVAQGIMTVDPLRFYLSWGERMEGRTVYFPVNSNISGQEVCPIKEDTSADAKISISIEPFTSLPMAKILINGKEKFDFSEKVVCIAVNNGDKVEIDSSAYNFPVDYKITDSSNNLAFPSCEKIYTANQSIVMLGKIIVK